MLRYLCATMRQVLMLVPFVVAGCGPADRVAEDGAVDDSAATLRWADGGSPDGRPGPGPDASSTGCDCGADRSMDAGGSAPDAGQPDPLAPDAEPTAASPRTRSGSWPPR